jgi:hypothetical protein
LLEDCPPLSLYLSTQGGANWGQDVVNIIEENEM